MSIVIAGGSGFPRHRARQRARRRRTRRHHPHAADTRPPATAPRVSFVPWTPDGSAGAWAHVVDGATAVVNLAGESIAAKRWSAAQKQKLRDSRLLATRSLTTAIRQAARPPAAFISGSAVGYYGDRGDETLTEASAPGHRLSRRPRAKTGRPQQTRSRSVTRVALIRTGIVLDRRGGALPKMLPPFRCSSAVRSDRARNTCRGSTRTIGCGWCRGCITAEGARGAAERNEPVAGHERRVLEGARTRAETAELAARAGIRAAPRARRNGRRAAAERPARAAGPRNRSRIFVPILQYRRGAGQRPGLKYTLLAFPRR